MGSLLGLVTGLKMLHIIELNVITYMLALFVVLGLLWCIHLVGRI